MPKGDGNRGKGKAIAFLRAHVSFDGPDCLIWPFFRDAEGYGRFGYDGIPMLKAHRWMCEAVHGPAPSPDHHAAHECNNGHLGCIHPKHVFWKTHAENTDDFVKAGRKVERKGRHPRKLSHEQVNILLNPPADKTIVQLAEEFGITYRHAKKVRQGISWRGGIAHKPGGKATIAPPL